MNKRDKPSRKPAGSGDAPLETLPFEAALERLEALVERLEEGKISLDESLSAYVEGTRLVRLCQERLDRAETVIRELTETEAGPALRDSSLSEDVEEDDDDEAEGGEDEDEDEEDDDES